jgi:hypothetical protein
MKLPTSSQFAFIKPAGLFILVLLLAYPSFGKQKDDVVIMKNGDKFTGEIKGLQYGELIFKSEYMKDSVHLDWERVEVLESKDTYIVTLSDGQRITGIISRKAIGRDDGQEFKISAGNSRLQVPSPEVITIDQREASFWNQLTAIPQSAICPSSTPLI